MLSAFFQGTRFDDGRVIVRKDGKIFSPKRSQRLRNHSPDGFNWGYGGSGPAQLALAILLDQVGEKKARQLYQRFKWKFVAWWKETWSLEGAEVRKWVEACERDAEQEAAGNLF